jgi:hypothetical protein
MGQRVGNEAGEAIDLGADECSRGDAPPDAVDRGRRGRGTPYLRGPSGATVAYGGSIDTAGEGSTIWFRMRSSAAAAQVLDRE